MTMAISRLEKRVKQNAGGEDYGPEALIITPSRELAMQIVRVAQSLMPQEAWPLVQQLIGGANIRRQLESMRSNKPLLVVGTPGRMAEHSRMGALRTHRTAAVVLDEVDQLLCQQFRDDMLRILSHTGSKLPEGPQIVRPHPRSCIPHHESSNLCVTFASTAHPRDNRIESQR